MITQILLYLSLFVSICYAPPGLNVYCCLLCGESHTMCKYNTTNTGKACVGFISSKLKYMDKWKILHMHNKLRQQMALAAHEDFPPAANMRELQWDDQLETIATRWNLQCKYFDYDECRTTPQFDTVGQNIGYKRAIQQRGTAEGIIQRWFNENAYIPRLYIVRLINTSYYIARGTYLSFLPEEISYSDFGHFTQLVWAKTKRVGCSVVRQRIVPYFTITLVCNYYPAGNYLFQPVYKTGRGCSKCPEGTECSTRFPGLCRVPKTECKPNEIYPAFCEEGSGTQRLKCDLIILATVSLILIMHLFTI